MFFTTRHKGLGNNPNTGPETDHTTELDMGYYMYVDSNPGIAKGLSDLLWCSIECLP